MTEIIETELNTKDLTLPTVEIDIQNTPKITNNMAKIKKNAIAICEFYKKLVITDDMVADIKKDRANINKMIDEVKKKRIATIKEFKKPIEEFELLAKETEKILTKASDTCKISIDKYENEIKKAKENSLKNYFNELISAKNIDFVNFERIDLNITLSASEKSLREQINDFVTRIDNDLAIISTMANRVEILAEYKIFLDVKQAIQTVEERNKRIEFEKQRQAENEARKQAEKEHIEEIKSIIPKQKIEQQFKMTFTVKGTKIQLQQIKNYLETLGVEYE